MTNNKNNTTENAEESANPLRVVFFCSRNKDNEGVEGFEQRNRKFLSTKSDEELMQRFEEFVFSGVPGEFCRFYATVNARDNAKVARALTHWMVDHPDQEMDHLESRVVSIAAQAECAAEKKWMFDFDADPALLDEFKGDVAACDDKVELEAFPTPNGLCIITNRGFDTRKLDLGGKWKDVGLKKDDQRCIAWKRNGE